MRKIISHFMTHDAPGWPGNPTVDVIPYAQIGPDSRCNCYMVSVFNHFGTHYDAPRHYNPKGPTISELPMERFFYEKPLLIDIPKEAQQSIYADELKKYEDDLRKCDLLLVRTGFEKYRETDPEFYQGKNPWFGSDAAEYLMENGFSDNIKAVGADFVSFCTSDEVLINDGHITHDYLLGNKGNGFICIIEDVSLKDLPAGFLKSAGAIPYFIETIDSAPVTMWAEY